MKYSSLIILICFMMTSNAFSQQKRKTYVFVHAQWHGAWSWKKLKPLLEKMGQTVVTFDLPAHGEDTLPPESVTFTDCVQKIVKIVNEQPEPVILVGHSSGGILISQAAEMLGVKKVAALVFLDAFLPNDGESVFSLAEKYGPAELGKTLTVSADHTTVSLDKNKVKELLYHDCSAEDVNYAIHHLRPGPLSVLATPAHLTAKNYGSIEKFYILCTQAKDMEKSRLAHNVPARIFTLAAGHSPFFSMPGELATILSDLRVPH